MKLPSAAIVALFIAAIVCANLSVAAFGAAALPYTAFIMIPFDLVTRDVLHERWKGAHLWRRMFALILVGGVLSAICSGAATRVAVASMAAFTLAGIADCYVYSQERLRRPVRMGLSNLTGALVDSTIFPLIALGLLDAEITMRQAAIKFGGSLVWVAILFPILFRSKPTTP